MNYVIVRAPLLIQFTLNLSFTNAKLCVTDIMSMKSFTVALASRILPSKEKNKTEKIRRNTFSVTYSVKLQYEKRNTFLDSKQNSY